MTTLIRLAELLAFLALVVWTVIFPLATLLSLALISLALLMPQLVPIGRPAPAPRR